MNSSAFITRILRSRWLAFCVHGCLWVLLYFAASGVGRKPPEYHETVSASTPSLATAPFARLEDLFSSEKNGSTINSNLLNILVTRHFIPSPSPSAPSPTTRKVEATYQGFYSTTDGPKRALVKLGEMFITAIPGSRVTTNYFVADASFQLLTLTNATAQTNVLTLNVKKELEVPLP
jgi:hypothetical protein